MPKKIIKIENVGPFSKLAHHAEEWQKIVAVYGENATGKTHISAILSAKRRLRASRRSAAEISPGVALTGSDTPRPRTRNRPRRGERRCPSIQFH